MSKQDSLLYSAESDFGYKFNNEKNGESKLIDSVNENKENVVKKEKERIEDEKREKQENKEEK